MKKPTIDDVASLAGVSRTTVSRVLNSQPNVREAVRRKVFDAVAALGFQVNQQARNLAGRKELRISLVHASDFENEPNSYFSSALELGATRAAARLGVQLLIHAVNQTDPQAGKVIAARIVSDDCDAVILTPPFADDARLLALLDKLERRVLCIAAAPATAELALTLGIDDRQAGYDIGRHLLAQGHRTFGYVGGLDGHISAASRFDGFIDALAESGVEPAAVFRESGNFTFRSGIECGQKLLGGDHGISALVCANDDMAAGALLAAHKLGLRIPEEIAITGFDDTPVSQIVWPPLTTIHQPLRAMGERAVERLSTPIDEEAQASLREICAHHLIARESSVASSVET